jgi:type II secretory pathway pseudopilin PulG
MTQFDQRYQHVETQYNADEINIHQQPLSRTERQQKQNRARMLERVQAIWIDGVLEPSVRGTAQIALELQHKPSAIATPLWHVLREFDKTGPLSSAESSIVQVYDHASGEVLILGEPGAGKTTLLLEVTRDLLERAHQDEAHPIPVVFPLSSWAARRQPLTEWLASELHTRYQVPLPLATSWIETDQVLPLLDGLDEVAVPHRAACVEAINTYRQAHGLLPTVVCSRQTDYLVLSTRLLLRTAVVVQPLTPEQIESYLTSGGERLETLRQILYQDADLQALASTPLMLNVLTVAYQGAPRKEIAITGSFEMKQEQVFASYVQRMLTRRTSSTRYTPQQTIHWLSWLARQMKRHNQTIFYLEHLQPTWLSGVRMHRAYDRLAVRFPAILIGVLVGFLVSLFLSDHNPYSLSLFFPYGLVGGLIGALLGGGKAVQFPPDLSPETRRNKWGRLLGIGSLRNGILLGCGIWLVLGSSSVFDNYKDYVEPIWGPIFGVIFGMCGFVLSMVLRRGQPILPGAETPARSWRNKWHRILPTGYLKHGLLIGGYFMAAATLSYGLVETIGEILSLDPLSYGLAVGPIDGLSFGLRFGLGAGLIGGLLSVIFAGWNGTIQPAEVIRWSWGSLWRNLSNMKHLRNGLLLGGFFGLTIGMIVGFSTGVSSIGSALSDNGVGAIFEPGNLIFILSDMWRFVVSNGLGLGLSIALSYWFLLGLLQGVSSDTLDEEHRLIPNQGIRDSASNSLRMGIVGALVTCFAYLLSNFLSPLFILVVNGLFSQHPTSINRPTTNPPLLYSFLLYFQHSLLSDFLFVGLVGGLIAGLLMGGGLACIRHYVLRFLSWRADAIPWSYARFLDDAAERILLRKVGGGYIFLHRLLLDYFASFATPFLEEAPPVSAIDDLPPAISSAPQTDNDHREEKASPTPPSRKTGFNKENLIATLFVVVLLLASGVSIFSVVQHAVQKANDATATAQAAQVEANTTAEALANASPITYPPQNKFPVLNDPLQDNSKGNNWQEDTSDWPDCKFINRAFDINTNGLEWCAAKTTDFTNFIYEVQMKIVKGDRGGIVFRVDPTSWNHYSFVINQDGSYSVDAYW